MKIFLTGASGFIGGHLLNALSARGHEVTCLLRGIAAKQMRSMLLPGVTLLEGDFTRPETWLSQVSGHDAVVNTVGIIRETHAATFEQVHEKAPIALFAEALRAGVKKIVQVSALGADEKAVSRYHLSKRAADTFLAEHCGIASATSYVVLRPSFVYGPQDQSMAFFLSMAAQPVTAVPGDGKYLVQPIYITDLVRALVASIERSELQNMTQDAGGAGTLSFDEMLDVLARRLNKPRALKYHVPWFLMNFIAGVTDFLGGHGPITSDELGMLRRGNLCSAEQARLFVERFDFQPIPFEAGMERRPLSKQDIWSARLNPLRIPLRLSVAFIWIATGVISACISQTEGLRLLEQVGLTGMAATFAMFGTSIFEIIIGLATALGIRVRLMGIVQLVLMFGFMGILSAKMPELWWHPFGALTKNIPLIGATLVMMAWE